MTLFEVGVVVAVILLLAAVLLPIAMRPPAHSYFTCVNNLKQVYLGGRIWAGDNSDIFPMGVSVTNGGSMELVATGNVSATFLLMSNELSVPTILACPMDKTRTRALDFATLTPTNISYFIGIDATNDSDPSRVIFGDCNLMTGGSAVKSGLLQMAATVPVTWAAGRHAADTGDIGLADGSVENTTFFQLQNFLQHTGLATNRLAIP